jgi:hypothetical protein
MFLFLVIERGDMQWLDHLQQVWEYDYISLTSNFWKKLKCHGLLSKLGFFCCLFTGKRNLIENSKRYLLIKSKVNFLCSLHGKTWGVVL